MNSFIVTATTYLATLLMGAAVGAFVLHWYDGRPAHHPPWLPESVAARLADALARDAGLTQALKVQTASLVAASARAREAVDAEAPGVAAYVREAPRIAADLATLEATATPTERTWPGPNTTVLDPPGPVVIQPGQVATEPGPGQTTVVQACADMRRVDDAFVGTLR